MFWRSTERWEPETEKYKGSKNSQWANVNNIWKRKTQGNQRGVRLLLKNLHLSSISRFSGASQGRSRPIESPSKPYPPISPSLSCGRETKSKILVFLITDNKGPAWAPKGPKDEAGWWLQAEPPDKVEDVPDVGFFGPNLENSSRRCAEASGIQVPTMNLNFAWQM